MKQIFFFVLYTVHWVYSPPTVLCAINNSHKWVQSHWCISDDVIIVHFLFSVTLVSFSFMNATTNPWSESKGFLCDAPTVRIPVVPSDGKVSLGNTWSSVNNPICFLMSHVTHPTLNELLARSLGVLSQTGIYGSEERLSGFTFQRALRFFFLSNNGSPTLHSDQSFPGIPVRLCSKTGIDPRKQDKWKRKVSIFFYRTIAVKIHNTNSINWLSE